MNKYNGAAFVSGAQVSYLQRSTRNRERMENSSGV